LGVKVQPNKRKAGSVNEEELAKYAPEMKPISTARGHHRRATLAK
jgi:hypothetical protein